MAVHVVGNVCLDTTFRLDRFPRPGETVNAGSCAVTLGGKGANQALAAARTGAATTLWAAVGQDAEGTEIRRRLLEAGLSDRGLVAVSAPSDRSCVLVDAEAENLVVSAVEAARAFAADRSGWREAAKPGDVLVMQNNLAPDTTAACLRAAATSNLFTLFNASPLGAEEACPFGGVDLVVVNRDEGATVTGCAEPREIAATLRSMGVDRAVVTLGSRGAILAEADGLVAFPAPAVVPVDTSGAGDVLAGTLAGCLDRRRSLAAALEIAIHAASVAVTRPGTFGSGPSHDEFADLLLKDTA
ncbi:PfkB family carbohydrate kinase [Aureimonas leprariae]|uniref:Ribokinase n=1 Tax=Plantimonas leprariae TaxID=2615207 RepID=A0A7V7TVQ3_9HYPH|nr:PfkB family carbohydrate kinase [Aureimonas leprariae]KAB0678481.1 ribokinase [Aureimonas leprariae]